MIVGTVILPITFLFIWGFYLVEPAKDVVKQYVNFTANQEWEAAKGLTIGNVKKGFQTTNTNQLMKGNVRREDYQLQLIDYNQKIAKVYAEIYIQQLEKETKIKITRTFHLYKKPEGWKIYAVSEGKAPFEIILNIPLGSQAELIKTYLSLMFESRWNEVEGMMAGDALFQFKKQKMYLPAKVDLSLNNVQSESLGYSSFPVQIKEPVQYFLGFYRVTLGGIEEQRKTLFRVQKQWGQWKITNVEMIE